jgi:hypothetical protein
MDEGKKDVEVFTDEASSKGVNNSVVGICNRPHGTVERW